MLDPHVHRLGVWVQALCCCSTMFDAGDGSVWIKDGTLTLNSKRTMLDPHVPPWCPFGRSAWCCSF